MVAGSLMNDSNGFEMTSFDTLQKICNSTEPALSHALRHASSCSCRVHTSKSLLPASLRTKMFDGEVLIEVEEEVEEEVEDMSSCLLHVPEEDEQSLKKKDGIIRPYLEFIAASGDEKASVAWAFVNSTDVLKKWPYICQYEWELIPGRSNEGKGDLVLSNGTMFLLVETQYLTSLSGATKCTKRTHKRGEIREACVSVFSLLCFHSSLLAPSRRSLTRAHI